MSVLPCPTRAATWEQQGRDTLERILKNCADLPVKAHEAEDKEMRSSECLAALWLLCGSHKRHTNVS